jgi:Mce-associated membrane protein
MPHWYQPAQPATAEADTVQVATAEADTAQADTAQADPAQADTAQADPALAAVPAEGTSATTARPRHTLALLILGALTVLLGGFGIWATLHASTLRTQAAQENTAVIDPAATIAVRDQIDSAVRTIFSYNYADTGATRQAAQRLLTGAAIQQYNSLFALVQRDAPAEKLVVTTTVTNSGVELLNGNQARVLIFVNQQDTRSGTSQTTYGGAMLAVTAIHQAGRWKIENIDTFS